MALLADAPCVRALAKAVEEAARGPASTGGRGVVATGASGSSTALIAAALARRTNKPVVLVVAHLDDADEAQDELISSGVRCVRLPAMEALAGESALAAAALAARARLAGVLPTLAGPCVLVAPIAALMQPMPAQAELSRLVRTLRVGERVALGTLTAWLASAGYRRVDAAAGGVEEVGDFCIRGGIVDVFPPSNAALDDDAPDGQSARQGDAVPIRLEFFGDELERISEVDVETLASDRALRGVELVAPAIAIGAADEHASTRQGPCALELVPADALAVLAETMEIVEQGRGYFERVTDGGRGVLGPPAVLRIAQSRFAALVEINQFSAGASLAQARVELPIGPLPMFDKEPKRAIEELGELARASGGSGAARTVVCCQTSGELDRARELLAEAHAAGPEAVGGYVHRGFVLRDGAGGRGLVVVPYHELVGKFGGRRAVRSLRVARAMDTFLDFDVDDYVVHQEHGIARYVGLRLFAAGQERGANRAGVVGRVGEALVGDRARARDAGEGAGGDQEEFLILEFASKSRLYVPAVQIDKVQKYVGGFAGKPQLSVLGGQKWQAQKQRVAESVRDLAAELLRVRAAREHLPGVGYPPDTAWQGEFEREFGYEETPDQLAALQEIKRDMQRARPMDRLLCGDVGFGKTELAIRAAFKAVEFGKQVAVLVPTTVLAEQHERTFRARFAGYPFRVESISRFKSDAQVRAVLEELAKGRVDVVIGTHRLLSQDVVFADLGLVVVDEEQRFGVEHKESLLRLRLTVDVLTLSATPIPRTLHMAMLGIRDISSLTTPPADRRAVVTEVAPYNQRRIAQAVERELAREGQVFFVHNRVHDIRTVADDVQRMCPPGTRVVVGHGQMGPHELEEVMLQFIRGEAQVLVSTTIIESGIDIPSANTIIIKDADRFGLSDLHQLRGRVGRGKHRGYCYVLLPEDRPVKEVAQKRLKALEQYSMLGAGFKIAMRDLEIRGAGNILGPEQSGHIAQVGYDMYCRLLERAVHDLRQEPQPEPASTTAIELGMAGVVPRAYIPSDKRRLAVYRRLATAATREQLLQARTDVRDAYGEPPTPVQRLFDIAEVRLALHALGVRSATIRGKDVVFLCKDAKALGAALDRGVDSRAVAAAARVVLTPLPPEEAGGPDVLYMRPPAAYLEPATLLAVLRARLGLAGGGASGVKKGPRPAKVARPGE